MLTDEIILLVSLGTVGMVILLAGLVIFFIRYNNKILQLKVSRQKDLLEAEITAKENEQGRIARGIHDQLGGNLTALNFRIQTIQKKFKSNLELEPELLSLKELVFETHQNIRSVSRDLLANDIEVFGLEYSLNELLNHSTLTDFDITFTGEDWLTINQKKLIYRVVQEMLNNAINHSKSTQFKIDMIFAEDSLKVDVWFDGQTFDWILEKKESEGMGLKNIESRINFLNGELKYTTSNNGNLYSVLIPKYEKD